MKVIILAYDESHIRMQYPNIRVVCPKNEKPRIKANWDKSLKTSIHGCIDNEGRWTITQEETANQETVCKHLDKVVESYPEYQVFMLLIDNAKYHRGDIITEHIYKLRGQGKNFKLVHFPRYCSDLNPIEQEWKSFKKEIHNKIITVKEKLISAVVEGIETVSTPKGLLSNYFPVLFGQN